MSLSAANRLATLLPLWEAQLQRWAGDGSLVAAACDALRLAAVPDRLQAISSRLASGDPSEQPPLRLLAGAAMASARGAYAAGTGTIYLNQDWLAGATEADALAVLSEELGHHLDALLNSSDTPGDEGALFAALLAGDGTISLEQRQAWLAEDDRSRLRLDGEELEVEQAAEVQSTPIPQTRPGRTAGEVRNQAAFAALKADGSVVTWGDPKSGGDSSSVASRLGSGVSQIFASKRAFAALKSDGSVVSWGGSGAGDSSAVASRLASGVSQIFSTDSAFAALKSDGSVVTWGDSSSGNAGGDSSAVAGRLTAGVTRIVSTRSAFAALKGDGSVVTWGNSGTGGNSSAVASQLSSGVAQLFATGGAFAALKLDGSVVSWGDSSGGYGSYAGNFSAGGNSSAVAGQLKSGVSRIASTSVAFAALKSDGSVVTWGDTNGGGNSSSVASRISSGVSQIYSAAGAFAALKSDGSVVTWGDGNGGDSSAVATKLSSGVTQIFATDSAFAALKLDGSLVTWGNSTGGGNSSAVANSLNSGVSTVFASSGAFAALKTDGSVVTWGSEADGGNSSVVAARLSSGVSQIFSADSGFAALKTDGSVVSWGRAPTGADSSAVASNLTSGVRQLAATLFAFAALKQDGSVVTWGNPSSGGDSSAVASRLGSGVSQIFASQGAFVALKSDGSVVTWGNPSAGGDSSAVASKLSSGVSRIVTNAVGAFAAIKTDGSVVTWGPSSYSSAVASKLSSGVSEVFAGLDAFAALKSDGSVVTWGDSYTGGDSSSVATRLSSGVIRISATNGAFAALKNDGSVVTWGHSIGGGATVQYAGSYFGAEGNVASRLTSGVIAISSNNLAFAALKSDGSVVAWGAGGSGGYDYTDTFGSGVKEITATSGAFAALYNDGSVEAWGSGNGGQYDYFSVANRLRSGVVRLFSNGSAFAALKSDGSVVSWGLAPAGGDSSAVAGKLDSGVSTIFAGNSYFAALKSDGSLVVWGGGSSNAGNSSPVADRLKSGVTQVVFSSGSAAALKSDGSVVTWGDDNAGNSGQVADKLRSGVASFANPFADDRLVVAVPNQTPTNITASASTFNENIAADSVVATLTATDPDPGDTVTWSLVPGTTPNDNSAFRIDGNQLRILKSPDFETKSAYTVRVRATDNGGLFSDKDLSFTVVNLNDPPTLAANPSNPTFSEALGANAQSPPITLFSAANASTVEPGQLFTGLTITINGLLDGAAELLSIDGSTIPLAAASNGTTASNAIPYALTVASGVATLSLNKPSGFTAAVLNNLINALTYQNTNRDNPSPGTRTLTLSQLKDNGGTANAGSDTAPLNLSSTIKVLASNDKPTDVTASKLNFDENIPAGSIVATLTATDPDSTSFTYILPTNASTDNSAFSIEANALKIKASPDFETKKSYNVLARATDPGGLFVEKLLNFTVLNLNEAPTDLKASAASLNPTPAATSFLLDHAAPTAPQLSFGGAAGRNSEPATVSVTGEAGATLALQFTRGSVSVSRTLTASGTDQAVAPSAEERSRLGEGIISVTAVATDPAGNGSIAASLVFQLASSSTTLAPSVANLELIGDAAINASGNALNNRLIGNEAANTLTGGPGKDLLSGRAGADRFVYTTLSDSLLSGFDVIDDYGSGDEIITAAAFHKGPLSGSRGTIASLGEAEINNLLTSSFAANTAAAFTVTGMPGTFLVLNNGTPGFQAGFDAILHLSNHGIGPMAPIQIS